MRSAPVADVHELVVPQLLAAKVYSLQAVDVALVQRLDGRTTGMDRCVSSREEGRPSTAER
jgi:hypothetical protein